MFLPLYPSSMHDLKFPSSLEGLDIHAEESFLTPSWFSVEALLVAITIGFSSNQENSSLRDPTSGVTGLSVTNHVSICNFTKFIYWNIYTHTHKENIDFFFSPGCNLLFEQFIKSSDLKTPLEMCALVNMWSSLR